MASPPIANGNSIDNDDDATNPKHNAEKNGYSMLSTEACTPTEGR